VACYGAGTADPPASKEPSPDRLAAIRIAVGGKDYYVASRALLEAAAFKVSDENLAKIILSRFPWERGRSPLDEELCPKVLGEAQGKVAGYVVSSLTTLYPKANERDRFLALSILGRMGKESQEAAPLLREQLKAAGVTVELKAAIMATLAAMQQASPQELEEMAATIKARGPAGLETVKQMIRMGRNPWMTEGIRKALIETVDMPWEKMEKDRSDFVLPCLLALGSLGEGDNEPARAVLGRLFREGEKTEKESMHYGQWFAGLLYAREDRAHRAETLKALFDFEPTEWFESGHSNEFVSGLFSGVRDEDFIKQVSSFLDSPTPSIAGKAANVLRNIGPAAAPAAAKLIALVEKSPDDHLRLTAAEALGMVATVKDLEAIEKLSRDAKGSLRDNLKFSIRIIKLEGQTQSEP
jgi:hypothetical protein